MVGRYKVIHMPERDWVEDSKCGFGRMDSELFWPDPKSLPGRTSMNQHARELCGGCPVMDKCARDAIILDDRGVIRAGVPISPAGMKHNSPPETFIRLTLISELNRFPTKEEMRARVNEWKEK